MIPICSFIWAILLLILSHTYALKSDSLTPYTLSLTEAENLALKSRAVELVEHQVQQLSYRHLHSILSWLPEITFGSMYAKLQKPQDISPQQRQTHLFSNQLELIQPIFSAELLGDLKLSRIAEKGAYVWKEGIACQILFQVRMLYLNALIQKEALLAQKEAVAYLNAAYEDVQKQYLSGSATSLSVTQAKALLSQAITRYYNTLKEEGESRRQLILILNLEENDLCLQPPELNNYPFLVKKYRLLQEKMELIPCNFSLEKSLSLFSQEEIEEWIAYAKKFQPQLKQTLLAIEEAKEKSKKIKGEYLPKILAFLDYGYYQPIRGQFFKQKNDFAGGIQLSWCLFNSFKREVKIKEARSFHEAATLAYQYKNDEVRLTIQNDLQRIEEAFFVYLTALHQRELAKQVFEESEVRFFAGALKELELQDLSRFLTEAQAHAKQSEYRLIEAYFQLKHDLGEEQ